MTQVGTTVRNEPIQVHRRCRFNGPIYWSLIEAGWTMFAKVVTTNGEAWATMVKGS